MVRGPDSDAPKDTQLSLRVDAETLSYLDGVGREWDLEREDGTVNRSAVLRIIIKSHAGLLFGNFFGVIDTDELGEEWGGVGRLLANAVESERPLPPGLENARLADISAPIPVLVAAADTELGGEGVEPPAYPDTD